MMLNKFCMTFFSVFLVLLVTMIHAFAADTVKVVTSTQDLASITKAIGGDKVEVFSIANGTQNPHFVAAKPSYILKLKNADMLVQVGLDLEPWLEPLVENSRNTRIQKGHPGYVDASRGIAPLGVPTGKVDRSMGDVHAHGNPHYWLDPVNAKTISANITSGLKRVDPDNAQYYEQQKQLFLKQLAAKITIWMKRAKPLQGQKILAYHDSWAYFTKRFGLQIAGYIEPKPGIPPSPKHIQSLIKRVKEEGISLIIMEPYFTKSSPSVIANATGAKIAVLPPSAGGTGADDYFALFDTILNVLLNNLNAKG
jgi:zinc/manganese transport system substrate-binding protein